MEQPARDAREDRRATLWVAAVAAFCASVVLDHFLPLAGGGLGRVLLMTVGGSALFYLILRPWAAQVADWSGRGTPGKGRPPRPEGS